MKRFYYPAVFHVGEDVGYWVSFPDLDGCITQGASLEDAVSNAEEALGLFVEATLEDLKEALPAPSIPSKIKLENETDFMMMVAYDPIAYAKKNSNKAVKKTLTIPEWLNELAEKRNINFSKLLQKALIKELDI